MTSLDLFPLDKWILKVTCSARKSDCLSRMIGRGFFQGQTQKKIDLREVLGIRETDEPQQTIVSLKPLDTKPPQANVTTIFQALVRVRAHLESPWKL